MKADIGLEDKEEIVVSINLADVDVQLIPGVSVDIAGKEFELAKVYLTNKKLVIDGEEPSLPINVPLGKIQRFEIERSWLVNILDNLPKKKSLKITYSDKNKIKEIEITAKKGDVILLFRKLKELCPGKAVETLEGQKPIRPGW